METTIKSFDELIKNHLPIHEIGVFNEVSTLYLKKRKKIVTNDLNKLSNDKVLEIIKSDKFGLNHQFFSTSFFLVNQIKFSFFTQKVDGKKHELSQVFIDNESVLITETKNLVLLEKIINQFESLFKSDLNLLKKEILKYEYE